ncbi:helix-turn-helix domain-containing protein [Granulicella sibirica]|uniref:helix-turn-helix domain-containing protein n=1 Tax=Granulicella sibirica TaxID=2479048 RepID=UPI00240D0690|nr:helix-turn-helix domain-containing protein [Granulicella sibirica]
MECALLRLARKRNVLFLYPALRPQIARAKGRLRGKQPKLSDKQQKELSRMHGTGQYTISDLAELFSISRPTVYRTLLRSARP